MLIDTHCHLDDYENIEDIINFDGIMIASGCDDESNLKVIELVNKYDNVYGTLGIHPESIDKITEDSFNIIINNLSNPKIVGIGEIGLDYHYTDKNKELQHEVFKKQLDIASKYSMPIVVHSRDSISDAYNILSQYNLRGSIHCFSSSLEMAQKFIKLGYKIGVGGVVTFKNGKKIQNIVENISLNDILLETDSPYLTPEPYRGKCNEPRNVLYVAEKIKSIKNVSLDEVISVTSSNAIYEFDLNI